LTGCVNRNNKQGKKRTIHTVGYAVVRVQRFSFCAGNYLRPLFDACYIEFKLSAA